MIRSQQSDGRPTLSIIIPTFNGLDYVVRCLESVERHRPAGCEVIVVDDGSTDGTQAALSKRFPEVRIVRLEKNRGFCAAANAGLAVANGRFIEMLNNDAEVSADWADRALERFVDPEVGSVAPLVLKLPYSGAVDSAGDSFNWIGIAKKRGEGAGELDFHQPVEVFGASASSAFYRREAILGVGGFPEDFGAYLDDVDLSWRLRLAGYKCVFEPASRVYHWVSRTHRVRSRRIQSQVARNSERLFWTNLPPAALAAYAVPHLAYVLVQLAYRSVKGDFGPWFAGKLSILGELPRLARRRREVQSLRRRLRPYAVDEPKAEPISARSVNRFSADSADSGDSVESVDEIRNEFPDQPIDQPSDRFAQ
jgi:GT2 family glycosyltransferase